MIEQLKERLNLLMKTEEEVYTHYLKIMGGRKEVQFLLKKAQDEISSEDKQPDKDIEPVGNQEPEKGGSDSGNTEAD